MSEKDDAREAHDALFERPFRDGPTDEVRDTFEKPTEEQALADWSVALDRSVPVTEENFLVRFKAAVDIAQDLARDAHHERQVAAETVGIVRELVSHAGLITLADQRVREMHSELVDMRRTNQDLLSVVYALGARVEQMGQALGLPEPAKRVPWYPKPIQAGYEGSGDKRVDEIKKQVESFPNWVGERDRDGKPVGKITLAEPQEAELVEVDQPVSGEAGGSYRLRAEATRGAGKDEVMEPLGSDLDENGNPRPDWRVTLLERKVGLLEHDVKLLRRTLLKFFLNGPVTTKQGNIDAQKDLGFSPEDLQIAMAELQPSGLILPS